MSLNPLAGLLLLCGVLVGCGAEPDQHASVSTLTNPTSCSEVEFDLLRANYFKHWLSLYPLRASELGFHQYDGEFNDGLSEAWLKRRHQLNETAFDRAQALSSHCYSFDAQLNRLEFIRTRQLDLVEETFPQRFLPLNPYDSPLLDFIRISSDEALQAFTTTADLSRYAARAAGLAAWVKGAIVNMKKGIDSKVTLPRALAQRLIQQLHQIIQQPQLFEQGFHQSLARSTLPHAVQSELRALHQHTVTQTIVPALHELVEFIEQDYLSHTRASAGVWGLPNGRLWYKQSVNTYVDDSHTLDTLHQFGLSEVARLQRQLQGIPFDANSTTSGSLLGQPMNATHYQWAEYSLNAMPVQEWGKGSIAFHPSLFAFVQGNALYRQTTSANAAPVNAQWQALSNNLLAAIRVVIDTGLHDKGWSKEQAVLYMSQNIALSSQEIETEVERSMALPGQALSAKLGEKAILVLQQEAEAILKQDFDAQEFQRQVLQEAVSLPTLKRRFDNWLVTQN